MILLLDTATPVARLVVVDGDNTETVEWRADRQLAKGLLSWLYEQLGERGRSWRDVEGIGVMKGPGSFTGLRIGITVTNTLAESLGVPIVGEMGEAWQATAIDRLRRGENDKIVLPYYNRDAMITTQRK